MYQLNPKPRAGYRFIISAACLICGKGRYQSIGKPCEGPDHLFEDQVPYPKWHQNGKWGKWHLVDSKCVQSQTKYYDFGEPVLPTITPAWSTIPLPSKALSKICKVCFKKSASVKPSTLV